MLTDRQPREQAIVLQTDTNAAANILHLVANILASDLRCSIGRCHRSSQHVDGRGLSRSIVAKQRSDLSTIHRQREILDSCLVTKCLRQTTNLDVLTSLRLTLQGVGDRLVRDAIVALHLVEFFELDGLGTEDHSVQSLAREPHRLGLAVVGFDHTVQVRRE